MILLIDNYDSFSYNLYQMIGEIAPDIRVVRNDACTTKEIDRLSPSAIVLSPGPGRPEQAGICVDTVKAFAGKIPILGICLGHQAICHAYGGTVSYAKKLMHGKQTPAKIDTTLPLFHGLPEEIPVARYHSLAAMRETLPPSLAVTAETADGEIMAVADREKKVYGLQFHPESILTPQGKQILENFLGRESK